MQVRLWKCACVALALVAGPAGAAHAQNTVYTVDEITQQPRLVSATHTADVLRSASNGQAGTVRLEFVVGTNGRVEPGTVRVVHSTNERLNGSAERAVLRIEFRPGEKDGKAVRTQVVLPLAFQS